MSDDDGGVCWFQTVAEEQEYLEYLDKINSEKVMPVPVKQAVKKEIENECIDCK